MGRSASSSVHGALYFLAQGISFLLAPPFTVPYSFYFILFLSGFDGNKISIFLTGLIFGSLLPIVIYLFLLKFKIISDPDASVQKERVFLYIFGIVLLLIGGVILLYLETDFYVLRFWFNNLLVMMASIIINKYYKISIHLLTLTATLVPLYLQNTVNLATIIILHILLSWARLYLKQHTAGQVALAIFVSGVITLFSFRVI